VTSTTTTTIPTGAGCADIQARIQAEIGDGSQFENRGQLMMQVIELLPKDGEVDGSCRACIVRQFARGVPVSDQVPCGPSDSARAAFSIGVDQPLSAVKLLLKATDTAEKALFLSKDSSIQPPVLNGPTDPTLFGASVELCSQAGHAFFDLPAQSWHVNGSGSVFKFTRTGSGADVKVALIKGGRTLKVVSKAVGLPLGGGMGPVGVRVSTGDVRNCALFTPETILKDEPGKYLAQSALAASLTDCSDASLGCSSLP
jgi:hypothetical protein